MKRAIIILVPLLAACAAERSPHTVRQYIDRVLAHAPGAAQPSKVVAAEIAFARAAKDKGQWTAFREFAAPGAQMHGRNGPFAAEPWLAVQTNPPAAVQWAPKAIWMSCDGELAVSQGRFRDPDGEVGTFVTVWQRQADDSYRWLYDGGVADDPQPGPSALEAPVGEGDIVVTGLDSIKGLVADCPRRGETIPAPPSYTVSEGVRQAAALSRDGTLRWRWEHDPQNNRRVVVDFLSGGRWQEALVQSMPAPKAQ